MDVDDVAADFPDLPIVLAHPSFPWQDEALAVATHKRVHIDLSGWSPKYFPPQLVRYANTLLADKVLFGSDAMITPTGGWPTSRPSTSSPRCGQRSSSTTPPACSASAGVEAPCATRDSARGPPAAGGCRPTAWRWCTATARTPTPSSTTGAATWPVLRGLGVGRGDRVAYLGPNDPALLETLFATAALGAVFVPLNWRLAVPSSPGSPPTAAAVLVRAADMAATGAAVAGDEATRCATWWRSAPTSRRWPAGGRTPVTRPLSTSRSPSTTPRSSSTPRARPGARRATLSHGNITWNCVNVLVDTDLASDEVALVCAPLFHVAALNMVAMPLVMKGGTTLLTGQFDPAVALELIERHRVTVMFGVPAMFNAMAQSRPSGRPTCRACAACCAAGRRCRCRPSAPTSTAASRSCRATA